MKITIEWQKDEIDQLLVSIVSHQDRLDSKNHTELYKILNHLRSINIILLK